MSRLHPELEAINAVYLLVQDTILPPMDPARQQTDSNLNKPRVTPTEARQLYERAIHAFGRLFPQLATQEVIAGYQDGCELLQRNIAGEMARAVQPEYIPVMETAIRDGHPHIAPMFVYALAQNLGAAAVPILIEALHGAVPAIRETAVYVAGEHHFVDLTPHIQPLQQDPVPQVARAAHRVLEAFHALDA